MEFSRAFQSSCILFCFTFLTACGGGSPTVSDTLIYGRGGDANALDPIHTDIGESVKVIVNIFEPLVAYDEETLDLVPGVAESWETSEDGREWTFKLRPNVKFHDETPLNAEAVVFTFERILDPDHPHVHNNIIPYYSSYTQIEKVEAVDDLTVKFTLKQPQATFLANIAMFPSGIVSPTAVKKYGADFTRHPVGTGPFQFVHWKPKQEIVLSRFDDYWGEPAGVKQVVFLPSEESSIRVTQLKRGEIHIADNLPPSEVDGLEKTPGVVVQSTPGINIGYLTMQTRKPPLDKPEVRQAICYAIDRDRLIEVAYAGHAQKAKTMVPPTLWGHSDDVPGREFDLEKAKQLLEEASKKYGFALPLKLELFVMDQPRPYMQQPRQTAIFIKDALEKVGFQIDIITNDIGQHFQRMTRGEHQLGLSGWSADIADPHNFLSTLLHSENINEIGGNNLSQYKNEEVDKLLDAAQFELDQEKRTQLYKQAQRLIYEDAPVLPLVHVPVRIAQRDFVKGYKLHPSSQVRLKSARIAEQ
ncbi:ABC transporter substrate-binding protein [Blastopirellula marina]|uniref:ABC transporter substrate-binding protein n=1 Tax=Blastopirellula marina TaxID=124 RepID=A0A2S8F670_9BACT|nr:MULTISPECIES: ABC transporter substrate-binding protein [Pirellulaceae]PQO27434.1 ABC transporter substrate-binding protein [Blastopirellula marina]RCS47971.1 ABC transporter substrate-binding protein [Bremerella cremea]